MENKKYLTISSRAIEYDLHRFIGSFTAELYKIFNKGYKPVGIKKEPEKENPGHLYGIKFIKNGNRRIKKTL